MSQDQFDQKKTEESGSIVKQCVYQSRSQLSWVRIRIEYSKCVSVYVLYYVLNLLSSFGVSLHTVKRLDDHSQRD